MAAGRQHHTEVDAEPHSTPEISICRTCPERSVFLEEGNTDGWIASDYTVEIVR